VGSQIFVTDADTPCMDDLAIVLLDRELTGLPIRSVRLMTGVSPGEQVRVIGYGVNEDGGIGTRRTRSDLTIWQVGTSEFRPAGDPIPPNTFAVGDPAMCAGDGGAPALSEPVDGEPAIVGVFAWSEGSCATATRNAFVQLASYRDTLVCPAFAAAGAEPWLEGAAGPGPCPPPDAGVDASVDDAATGNGGSGGASGDGGSGGASGDGGTSGSDSNGGAGGEQTNPAAQSHKKHQGCGCKVPKDHGPGPTPWGLLLLLGAFVGRRRRRSAPARARVRMPGL
jgi:MYXO-CTERM domain-containing protein